MNLRLLETLLALWRGQIFLFPRLNTILLRVYGKVSVRGPKRSLRIGRRVVFLGDAIMVTSWEYDDFIELHDNVIIEHACYLNAHFGSVKIGRNSFVGIGAVIQGMGSVIIGEDVLLGPGTKIFSSDHPVGMNEVPRRFIKEQAAQILIGDDVWIGADSIVLKGSSITSGSVIAAASIVRGKLDERGLYGNQQVLAKIIRRI